VIASKEEVTEILRGELDELVLNEDTPPRKGSVQLIQAGVGKRAACAARILDHWPCVHGGHVVRFEVVPRPVAPRLLRRKGGYASDARGAMRDSTTPAGPAEAAGQTGVPHPLLEGPSEPEGVDAETLAHFSDEARMLGEQARVARRREYEHEPVVQRLESLIIEAERLGIDPAREMARLEAGLAKLERRISLARQQRRAA
jgi:hypothetical protein